MPILTLGINLNISFQMYYTKFGFCTYEVEHLNPYFDIRH